MRIHLGGKRFTFDLRIGCPGVRGVKDYPNKSIIWGNGNFSQVNKFNSLHIVPHVIGSGPRPTIHYKYYAAYRLLKGENHAGWRVSIPKGSYLFDLSGTQVCSLTEFNNIFYRHDHVEFNSRLKFTDLKGTTVRPEKPQKGTNIRPLKPQKGTMAAPLILSPKYWAALDYLWEIKIVQLVDPQTSDPGFVEDIFADQRLREEDTSELA